MYYNRRLPGKRMRDYFMPFFIIVVIIAIIVFGWRILNQVFISDSLNTTNERVFLNIENGSAKAMMEGKSEWKNAPDNIYLYKGEKLKTGPDGRATLTFADQSIMRLESNSEVEFIQLKKKKDDNLIEVALNGGQVWTKIERITNPDSGFTIVTDMLTIDSKGGVVAVDYPGTVYVIDGSAQVGIKYDDEIIKTVNVGVGQQFMVDATGINDINEDLDVTLIFAMSDAFESSNWYRWNMKKDGAISAFEESEEDAETEDLASTDDEDSEDTEEETVLTDRLVSITTPSPNSATNKSTVSLEGLFNADKVEAVYIDGKKASVSGTNKWKIYEIALTKEGENKLSVEAEGTDGVRQTLDPFVITYDSIAPDMPKIEEPSPEEGETSVTIDDIEQIIKGSVSSDTYAVIVNDYKLSKYVPGSKEWQYYAKTAYGNLEVGENEYKVIAEDKAGNQSEPATITLVLEQETVDEAGGEDDTETGSGASSADDESLPASTSEGGVTITEPNGGESFTTSETEFDIKGAVPANTAKVEVNGYKLTLYQAGDTAYKYSAKSSFGNLEIGEKNEYAVKAYDADDNLLGSASITIDVQSGSASAPTITMPSTSGAYTTTLDEIVLGGAVGKWIQKVYINDQLLSDYIPGSEQWRKTITLSAGENTFTVYGEQDGDKTASVSITISYTP
jgi:hypothetical protein